MDRLLVLARPRATLRHFKSLKRYCEKKMAFEISKCCFCVELRTGCLIIGYISLIGNIIFTLMTVLGLAGSVLIMYKGKSEHEQGMATIAMVVFCILLVIFIVNQIFIILLLVGLHKYKRGHVKAYLIFTGIFIVFSMIMFILSISIEAAVVTGSIPRNLLTMLLSIYFLMVIRSYYLKMDDPVNRPAIYNTA